MNEIDFVILWVDSNDVEWRNSYLAYKELDSKNIYGTSVNRFRDWNNLNYWFRSVEENCPWVRKIHLVTSGHFPLWLKKDHPKLNLVKHSDFIDDAFLPTFNSHTIELNIHKIKDLSDKFVYFNDDFFINKSVSEDFFFKNGLPCDYFVMDSLRQKGVDNIFGCIRHRSISFVNQYYNKKEVIRKFFFKIYNPIYRKGFLLNMLNYPYSSFSFLKTPHLPISYLKESFFKTWELDESFLKLVCSNKFRQPTDINQYAVRNVQLVNGFFFPVNPDIRGNFYNVRDDNISDVCLDIIEKRCNMICLNDGELTVNFNFYSEKVLHAFNSRYPKKSSFEV
ncbi:stealth family protein [Acinetobacter zhairhuonensis]|uniref:stealth family protein n=1 Tax=Acinetobacter sp. A7.4 TaxID=2919921 RepID=UPI001F4F595D|nr:stealth family protein [Acinetobacter sp. A7.4]MCJ8161413.1 stealth family protein [Acinetobacter sp. A7.4]